MSRSIMNPNFRLRSFYNILEEEGERPQRGIGSRKGPQNILAFDKLLLFSR